MTLQQSDQLIKGLLGWCIVQGDGYPARLQLRLLLGGSTEGLTDCSHRFNLNTYLALLRSYSKLSQIIQLRSNPCIAYHRLPGPLQKLIIFVGMTFIKTIIEQFNLILIMQFYLRQSYWYIIKNINFKSTLNDSL